MLLSHIDMVQYGTATFALERLFLNEYMLRFVLSEAHYFHPQKKMRHRRLLGSQIFAIPLWHPLQLPLPILVAKHQPLSVPQ